MDGTGRFPSSSSFLRVQRPSLDIPKVTENTVNDLMAEYLRSRGLKLLSQETAPTVPGGTKKPDFWLANDGEFPGEGEWLSNRWEGFVQARDYSELLEANAAFLIAYPDGLRKAVDRGIRLGHKAGEILHGFEYSVAFLRPGEQTDLRRLPLENIPEWLRERVYQTAPPAQDVSEVIQLLRQTVGILTRELSPGAHEELRLFRNLLGGDPTGKTAREAARDAAGYLLLNQIAFYRVLSHHYPKKFKPIEPEKLADPADLHEYFKSVLKVDYIPVFSVPVALAFTRKSLKLLQKSVKAVYGLSPETISRGTLGKIFHELIPLEIRKPIAAYYTLEGAASLLAGLAIAESTIAVMDPACGSGTLLAASYHRVKELTERAGRSFSEAEHRDLVENRITGTDIMAFAAHLSTIHLALQAPEFETNKVRIGVHDATVLRPGMQIPPISILLPRGRRQRRVDDDPDGAKKELVEAGAVFPSGFKFEPIPLKHVDLVIMNPPFTRQQRLSRFDTNYLSDLRAQFRSYDEYINQRMPYCNYFLLLADRFLQAGGRLATVLPATILRGDSSTGLRRFLNLNYRIDAILIRDDQRNFSEDTDFQEILLVATKGAKQASEVDFVILHRLDGGMAQDIRNALKSPRGPGNYDHGDFLVRRVGRGALNPANWFRPASVTDARILDLVDKLTARPVFSPLGVIASDIRAKDQAEPRPGPTFPTFSLNAIDSVELRGDNWQLLKVSKNGLVAKQLETGDHIQIPTKAVRRLFRRIPHRGIMDVSSLEEFVVADRFPNSARFLRLCEVTGVQWPSWQTYLDSRTSNLGLADRFNIAAGGTRHVAYFDEKKRVWARIPAAIVGLSSDEAKVLAMWFNSTPGLLQLVTERMPTEGAWMQFHKFIFKDLRVPNPRALPTSAKKRLLVAFDQLRSYEFPSIREQLVRLSTTLDPTLVDRISRNFGGDVAAQSGIGFKPREDLDAAVLEAIGMDERESRDLRSWLYDSALEAVLVLHQLMAGAQRSGREEDDDLAD